MAARVEHRVALILRLVIQDYLGWIEITHASTCQTSVELIAPIMIKTRSEPNSMHLTVGKHSALFCKC